MKKLVENWRQALDEKHYDEGSMVVNQLNRLSQLVSELQSMVDETDNHEEWVESKITKAHDYISTVVNYLNGEKEIDDTIDEGIDNVTPENVLTAAAAIKQVLINFSPAIVVPALVMTYKDFKKKREK